MKKRGLTLIELLLITATIGVLAAILAPALARTHEQAAFFTVSRGGAAPKSL
jgi:Tfp pilus assembly protein PilE